MNAFELWCWRELLRILWTARRSNQSILKEISPECSWEWLMLKLKLQYFSHLMRRTDSLVKTLMKGKIEGGSSQKKQMMRWLDGIIDSLAWVWVNSGSWWWTGRPGVLQFMGRIESDMTEQLNWTELASLMAQMIKNPSVMWRRLNPWVRNLLWRRKCQPTSVFLPGEFHGQEPGGLLSMGSQRMRDYWACNIFTFFHFRSQDS